jgi:hypothetical protein
MYLARTAAPGASLGLDCWPGLCRSSGRLVQFDARSHRVSSGENRNPDPSPAWRGKTWRCTWKMHVEDFLPGRLTVCKEESEPFAAKLGSPLRSCGELPDSEQLRTVLNIQVGEIRRVTTRHHEHVPRTQRAECP